MVKGLKENVKINKSGPTKRRNPRCLPIAEKGITTSAEFAGFMSALMSDLVSTAVTPQVGNALCNAGGKLLKVVELELKYGKTDASGSKVLPLTH